MTEQTTPPPTDIEWPTLAMLALTYGGLALGTWLWSLSGPASILLTGWFVAQHSSLQHEALHGHPFRARWLNELLVFPSVCLIVPYGRFRDTHLQHHYDPNLTDPYDDPESAYVAPQDWAKMSGRRRWMLGLNNTLFGRMTIGVAYGMPKWMLNEARLVRQGTLGVARDWLLNALGWVPVLAWLAHIGMPLWAYAISAFLGLSLLRIRTFLEHRASETCRERTVIVEDKGPLALLFLNNNFHSVHHSHPAVAWYKLPALYRSRQEHFLRRNGGYVFANYRQIFARYFFRAKEPVMHPIWPVKKIEPTEL
jgi:fatty acid desaturase